MKKNRYIIVFLVLVALILSPFKYLKAPDSSLPQSAVSAERPETDENVKIIDASENDENAGYYAKNDNKKNDEKNGYCVKNDNEKNSGNAEYYGKNDNKSDNKFNDEKIGYFDGLVLFCQKSPENYDKRARIDFIYGDKTWRYVDELIEAPDHLIAELIHDRKINAPLDEKMRMADKCLNAGATYKDALLYVFPLLDKTVLKLKKSVDCNPVDSTIKFKPEERPMFTITREKNGYELIETRLYQDIYYSLKRSSDIKLSIIPKTLYPAVTSFENVQATNLRAKFSTDYSQSIPERKHNIRLALSKINGKVLLPGDEFSFNKTVGRRTEKNGFLTAKIIMKGEYVDGVGGGVCQASTTVYNCAIRADLEITSVKNHSLTSSYVPVSFDAMVNSGSSDLKFKNNSKYPVFIRSFGTESYAQVEIYGTALPYRISTESVIISKKDAPPDKVFVDEEYKYVSLDAEPGSKMRVQYSHGEVESEGYLVYHSLSGAFIEKKLIRKDVYSACEGLVAVAPEKKPEA